MRVLTIGDLHEPVAHPGYLQFCKDLYKEFRCDAAVFIGDVADWHAISFHDKEPECPGAGDEYEQTKAKIKAWHRAFPKAKVCVGNHDERPSRLAKTRGIPERFLKDYNTLWETPTWVWDYSFLIDEVYYCHGTGTSGIHPAWNKSGKMLLSVVMGHCHSRSGVKWRVNPLKRIFAMDVGCGIDMDAYQFVYGRACDDKPILSAGVVIDGEPVHRMMPIGKGEKYHKSKFKRG
jgi:hypothetical protein